VCLLDVHTQARQGHVLGSIHLKLPEMQSNIAAWTPWPTQDVPLIVYCTCKGRFRSAIAAQMLFDARLTNVIDLLGDLNECQAAFSERYTGSIRTGRVDFTAPPPGRVCHGSEFHGAKHPRLTSDG